MGTPQCNGEPLVVMGKRLAQASGRQKLTCASGAATLVLGSLLSYLGGAPPRYEQIVWLRFLDGHVSKTNLNRDVVVVEEADADEAANAAVVRVSSAAAA